LQAEKARWAKEKTELEKERDVLKRSVVLWVKDAMNQ
jgi:transposase